MIPSTGAEHVAGEVLGAVLPFPVTPSQTGLFFLDDANVRVSNYRVSNQRGRAFVVMQFSSPFTELYEVIKKVCDEFQVDAHKADGTYGPGLVISDIARDISHAEFVIAEITPANPNVYYELGYAHAINKPAILLADRSIQKAPFDTPTDCGHSLPRGKRGEIVASCLTTRASVHGGSRSCSPAYQQSRRLPHVRSMPGDNLGEAS